MAAEWIAERLEIINHFVPCLFWDDPLRDDSDSCQSVFTDMEAMLHQIMEGSVSYHPKFPVSIGFSA